jgi:hypothetical protein
MMPAETIDDPEAQAKAERLEAEKQRAKWTQAIEEAEKDRAALKTDAQTVVNAFGLDRKENDKAKRRFEIAWANREIMQQSTYDRPPMCVVRSRYLQADPVARVVSEVMERAVNTNNELCGMHSSLERARDELVDYSIGTVWVRYEPDFAIDETGIEVLAEERVTVDFVGWRDFIYPRSRTWNEVPWVGRRAWFDKKRFVDRFGEEKLSYFKWPHDDDKTEGPKGQVGIWEIWCKTSRKVYFVCNECPVALEISDPFLNFRDFFPCPKPAMGTLRADRMVPIPDVIFYKSQLLEVNQLTARIHAIADAMKVRGFYASGASAEGADAIEAAMKSNDDRAVMIPVPNWAALADKSNMGITWLPVEAIAKVLTACIEVRRQIIEDIYQITGISDILRGASQASETLGAQQIKAQWGSVRLRKKQNEMIRLAADTCRLVAEVISEIFQPETIVKMTQMQIPAQAEVDQQMMAWRQAALQAQAEGKEPPAQPDPPKATLEQVIAMMRDDRMRSYAIDIETDSTAAADDSEMQGKRVEFATVTGNLLQGAVGLAAAQPELADLMGETLKFVARGFRVSRQLEQSIDDAVDSMKAKAQAAIKAAEQGPAQPPPDPAIELEREKMAADLRVKQAEMQVKQADLGLKQGELQLKAAEIDDRRAERMARDTSALQETQLSEFSKALAMLIQTLNTQAQQQAQISAAMLQAMTAPKAVVFDPKTGRPIGVETKLN